ncbi:hypothetical protein BDN70DRAFT_880225 [Pholiota conissans]|uniref:BTB domain-containing protein n=1 Tax=Pholiota conissans TaxID=109636 RepID=A0A9P5YZ43_9AGAR|nr:hypothetical protein BDN70DRAFT_880225 [Pholiota conissans]
MNDSESSTKARQTHDDFDFSDSDVTIQSSDGILFKLHRRNLEFGTGAFPPAEVFQTEGEITQLTEKADILAVMFQFVYPRRHPDLEDLVFELVIQVAEAVEKYEVFAAMNTCRLRLRHFITKHAAEVMGHFVRHNYSSMVDECVPHIARSPLIDVLELLPPECVLPWLLYQDAWKSVFKLARKYIKAKPMDGEGLCHHPMTICNRCRLILNVYVNELEETSSLPALHAALDGLTPVYPGDCLCKTCATRGCKYLPRIMELCRKGVQSIPPFSEFLKSGYQYRIPEMRANDYIN